MSKDTHRKHSSHGIGRRRHAYGHTNQKQETQPGGFAFQSEFQIQMKIMQLRVAIPGNRKDRNLMHVLQGV
jgi:hypothetical protein